MSEENKTLELNDEDLEKVSGGLYCEKDGPKYAVGFRYKDREYADSYFFEISRIIGFKSQGSGYSYKVNMYFNSILATEDFATVTDYDIEMYGTPYTN